MNDENGSGGLSLNENGGGLARRETSSEVLATRAQALVQARVLLAIKSPRDFERVRQRVLKDCQRPGFADTAIYAKPVGGRTIEGPSIRFAESVARNMGNLLIESFVVYEDDDVRRLRVSAMDLETNMTTEREVSISKTVERLEVKAGMIVLSERTNSGGKKTYTVRATEDDLLNKTNAAISKARRNVILELCPADIVEEAMATANKTLATRDAKDPDAAIRIVFDSFDKLGISVDQVREILGHRNKPTTTEINLLRRIYLSIEEGTATWSTIVEAYITPRKSAEAGAATLKEATAAAAKSSAPAAAARAPATSSTPAPTTTAAKPPATQSEALKAAGAITSSEMAKVPPPPVEEREEPPPATEPPPGFEVVDAAASSPPKNIAEEADAADLATGLVDEMEQWVATNPNESRRKFALQFAKRLQSLTAGKKDAGDAYARCQSKLNG